MAAGSADAAETLARAHFQAGRFEDALRLLDAALAAEPRSAQLWNNRGTVLARLKRFAAAEESFSRAVALDAEFTAALANRAQARMELNRYQDAIADYETLLRGKNPVPFARGSLIRAKLQCCDWRGLAEEWERALAEMRAGRAMIPPMVSTALSQAPEDQLLASE
ncbi:MAG TPA: tetratricopeptide repeat protein, partial [Micropepsaceae bacterium]|nr:tetratricopeptide repeat protein [Micropepsaceae bacterium]